MLNRLLAWLFAASLALSPVSAHAVDDLWSYDAATPGNNTNVGGVSTAEGQLPGLLNDAIRALISQVKRAVANQGSDITSVGGAPAICATGTSAYVKVTGTTTVTSFGTAAAGCSRWVTFTGALQITHNATSMILPGGANYTTAAGDVIWAVSEGSGNWRVRIFPAAGTSIVANTNGVHKLWLPAAAMRPSASSPAASADWTPASSDIQVYTLDFDATSIEIAHFNISMPSSWNEGTISFIADWTAASGSGGVAWLLSCQAKSEGDPLGGTNYTNTTVTDTLTTAEDLHRTAESSAITVQLTPAANDTLFCRVLRNPSDGGDTLAVDARLIGIELFITTDAATDAP